MNVHAGLAASAAKKKSAESCEGVVQAQTVASMRACLPAAKLVPSAVETLRRSFDSSEWNVPDVPSAHESLIVFGWLGSGPSAARPVKHQRPEAQGAPERRP